MSRTSVGSVGCLGNARAHGLDERDDARPGAPRRRWSGLLLVAALGAEGCGGKDAPDEPGETGETGETGIPGLPEDQWMATGDAWALWVGQDGDGAGTALASGDLDGDGNLDLLVGASYSSYSDQFWAGRVYAVHSPMAAGEQSLADADRIWTGEDGHMDLGSSVTTSDLDGDGLDDVAMAAPGDDRRDTNEGTVYVVLGGVEVSSLDAEADAVLYGDRAQDWAGLGLESRADLDGDGELELVVGARQNAANDTPARVYVVPWPVSGAAPLSERATVTLESADPGDEAGRTLVSTELDGDGLSDLVIGAPFGGDHGMLYVAFGDDVAGGSLEDVDTVLEGDSTSGTVGLALSAAGDVDGDGLGDLAIGDCYWGGGAALVVLGPPASGPLTAADVQIHASDDLELGYSIASAGDADGDGLADLLVGAPAMGDLKPGAGGGFRSARPPWAPRISTIWSPSGGSPT